MQISRPITLNSRTAKNTAAKMTTLAGISSKRHRKTCSTRMHRIKMTHIQCSKRLWSTQNKNQKEKERQATTPNQWLKLARAARNTLMPTHRQLSHHILTRIYYNNTETQPTQAQNSIIKQLHTGNWYPLPKIKYHLRIRSLKESRVRDRIQK